jgi:hypothetical protein
MASSIWTFKTNNQPSLDSSRLAVQNAKEAKRVAKEIEYKFEVINGLAEEHPQLLANDLPELQSILIRVSCFLEDIEFDLQD